MATKTSRVARLGLTLFLRMFLITLLGVWMLAGTVVAQQKPEDIPDAPSATRPIPPPPPPSPRQEAEDAAKEQAAPNASGEGVTTGSKEMPRSAPDSATGKAAINSPPRRPCLR